MSDVAIDDLLGTHDLAFIQHDADQRLLHQRSCEQITLSSWDVIARVDLETGQCDRQCNAPGQDRIDKVALCHRARIVAPTERVGRPSTVDPGLDQVQFAPIDAAVVGQPYGAARRIDGEALRGVGRVVQRGKRLDHKQRRGEPHPQLAGNSRH